MDTLGDILRAYIRHAKEDLGENTAYVYELTINAHLMEPFGKMRNGQLTTAKLQAYREKRKAEGDKDSTINRELSYLRAAMRLQAKQGRSLTIPWFPITNEDGNARQGYQEEPNFLRFLSALIDDLKPFACCAYYGGMRRGELVKLELRDIDVERRFIVVRFGKNGDSRSVPIYDGPMLQWLQWLWEHRQPSQVKAFVFSDGRPVTLRNFYAHWHAAAKTSGVGYFIPHDGRRSSNRRLSREGVPQALRMKVHGWKTPDMDRRYGVVDTADAEAVRILMDTRRTTAKTTASAKSLPEKEP
ncbi:MAG: tyrosine-type recombinase/integrase [Acidobacteriaceae bacterium]|nr:tyrosine-type recombinase/integrase [Acidobacteriaceae bacterium]